MNGKYIKKEIYPSSKQRTFLKMCSKQMMYAISEFNKQFQNIFTNHQNLTNSMDFRNLLNELFPNIYSHLTEDIKERASRYILRDEINKFLFKYNLPIPNREIDFLPKKVKSMDKEIILYYLLDIIKRICLNKNILQIYTMFPRYNKEIMKEDYLAQQIMK